MTRKSRRVVEGRRKQNDKLLSDDDLDRALEDGPSVAPRQSGQEDR